MDTKDYLLQLARGASDNYFEFSDRAGPVLEYEPLKVFGSGYWGEKYARESLARIDEFERNYDVDSIDVSSKEFKNFCFGLWKDNKKSLFYWLGSFSLQLCAVGISLKYLADTKGDSAVFSIFVPYIFLAHEYACPSSIRKYHELINSGETELASIITPNASGNKALKFFVEKHPKLMQRIMQE